VLDLYEELAAVVGALDAARIEYALCGGIAMAVHGFVRATVDIGLFVQPDTVEAIESVVAPLGYRLKANPMRFSDGAVEIRRVSKIDEDGDVMTLDLLLVRPATEEVWSTRQRLPWNGASITVTSREGLIALKRFRSSKQDLLDIENLSA
jgi:hypothetical protein